MAFDFPDTNGLADGFRVTNPKTGTEYSWQASTQKWVAVNPAVTGDFVRRSGDIMSGQLILGDGGTPTPGPIDITVDSQAVHKQYVDDQIKKNAIAAASFHCELLLHVWSSFKKCQLTGNCEFFGSCLEFFNSSVTRRRVKNVINQSFTKKQRKNLCCFFFDICAPCSQT